MNCNWGRVDGGTDMARNSHSMGIAAIKAFAAIRCLSSFPTMFAIVYAGTRARLCELMFY